MKHHKVVNDFNTSSWFIHHVIKPLLLVSQLLHKVQQSSEAINNNPETVPKTSVSPELFHFFLTCVVKNTKAWCTLSQINMEMLKRAGYYTQLNQKKVSQPWPRSFRQTDNLNCATTGERKSFQNKTQESLNPAETLWDFNVSIYKYLTEENTHVCFRCYSESVRPSCQSDIRDVDLLLLL